MHTAQSKYNYISFYLFLLIIIVGPDMWCPALRFSSLNTAVFWYPVSKYTSVSWTVSNNSDMVPSCMYMYHIVNLARSSLEAMLLRLMAWIDKNLKACERLKMIRILSKSWIYIAHNVNTSNVLCVLVLWKQMSFE